MATATATVSNMQSRGFCYTESAIQRIFIGKYLNHPSKPSVLIADIKQVTGYPENFPTYYSVYSVNNSGEKYWVINLPEHEFQEDNAMFSLSNPTVSKKRGTTHFDIIQNNIKTLRAEYDKIEWGYHYKSELTYAAVEKLEKLDYKSIVNDILKCDVLTFEQKWNLAKQMTDNLVYIINDADNMANKLVNGSIGEWCPNAVCAINDMWGKIMSYSTGVNDNYKFMAYIGLPTIEKLGDYAVAYGLFKGIL